MPTFNTLLVIAAFVGACNAQCFIGDTDSCHMLDNDPDSCNDCKDHPCAWAPAQRQCCPPDAMKKTCAELEAPHCGCSTDGVKCAQPASGGKCIPMPDTKTALTTKLAFAVLSKASQLATCNGQEIQKFIGQLAKVGTKACNKLVALAMANPPDQDAIDAAKCPCFENVPAVVADQLDCKFKAGDDDTIKEQWSKCQKTAMAVEADATCDRGDVHDFIGHLAGVGTEACNKLVALALANPLNQTAIDEAKCPCFAAVPGDMAAQLDCKFKASDDQTIKEQWAACQNTESVDATCNRELIKDFIGQLAARGTEACNKLVALATANPPNQDAIDAAKCPCFATVPAGMAVDLDCKFKADDSMTIKEQWTECQPPTEVVAAGANCNSTMIEDFIQHLAGVGTAACNKLVALAMTKPLNQTAIDAAKCPCFVKVPADMAAQLDCKFKADDDETIKQQWAECQEVSQVAFTLRGGNLATEKF